MNALLLGLLLAGQLPAMVLAAPSPLARQSLRAHYLEHRLFPPVAFGRQKADETGPYDVTSVQITLALTPDGRPTSAVFVVDLQTTRDLAGTLTLLAVEYAPTEVRDADGNLDFEHVPEQYELLIRLREPLRSGRSLTLTIDAELDLACDDPASCQFETTPFHLAQFGWYPASFDNPLDDRFQIRLSVPQPAGLVASLSGGSPIARGERVTVETRDRAILAAFALGPYAVTRHQQDRRTVEAYVLPTASGEVVRLASKTALDALDLYDGLCAPYPEAVLSLTTINNRASAGLGPEANIFLPEALLIDTNEEVASVRDEVIAHEIGHQYFFNLIGVTGLADAWLSESFAEFFATRFSERRRENDAHFRGNYWSYVLLVAPNVDAPLASEAASMSPRYFEIVYEKGSSLLEQLRRRLGDANFDGLMRRYCAAYVGRIATTAEFLAVVRGFDPAAAEYATQVTSKAGFVTLEVSARRRPGVADSLELDVRQRPGPDGLLTLDLPLRLHLMDGRTRTQLLRLQAQATVQNLGVDVSWVELDPELTTFRRVRPQPSGDVNLDGYVDGLDFLDVRFAQGRVGPTPDWDDRLDTNADQVIDDRDLEAVSQARIGD